MDPVGGPCGARSRPRAPRSRLWWRRQEGGVDDDDGRQCDGPEDVPELPHRLRHGNGLSRSGALLHGAGLGRDVERVLEPPRLQARQRARRRHDRSGAGDGPAAGLRGRPDVHAHAALGLEVLGRDGGEGGRLRVRDQARLPRRLARRRLLHEHRRRGRVLEDEEGRDLRDHDRRRHGQDHDQARQAPG